jgi:hypothetical protein
VYYVTLTFVTVIGVLGMRAEFGWNVLYLSNWQMAAAGVFRRDPPTCGRSRSRSSSTSLAVGVLLAPRRVLPWAIGSMVAVALITRTVLLSATNMWPGGVEILTPSAFDSLGLGALLALLGGCHSTSIASWRG